MRCEHTDEQINGQDLRVERAAGCKGHPYVICAGCGERVWVHVKGFWFDQEGTQWHKVVRCENPPLHFPTLSKIMGREMTHFTPKPMVDS